MWSLLHVIKVLPAIEMGRHRSTRLQRQLTRTYLNKPFVTKGCLNINTETQKFPSVIYCVYYRYRTVYGCTCSMLPNHWGIYRTRGIFSFKQIIHGSTVIYFVGYLIMLYVPCMVIPYPINLSVKYNILKIYVKVSTPKNNIHKRRLKLNLLQRIKLWSK